LVKRRLGLYVEAMVAPALLPRARWLALLVLGFVVCSGAVAFSSSAQTLGTLSSATVDLCITKAGPDKGTVRFVHAKQPCRAGEMHVQVVRSSRTRGVWGSAEDSGSRGGSDPVGRPGAISPTGADGAAAPQGFAGPDGATGYLRVESRSPNAGGDPETASTTVSCPGERKVVSGGYEVNVSASGGSGNPGDVGVTEDRATSDADWSVTAFAAGSGDVGTWSVTAYAICASVGA
jgi:hypothetical protein